jgi:transposase
VREIRRDLAAGDTCRDIAARVGVSHGSINRIANGQTWKHVTDKDENAA